VAAWRTLILRCLTMSALAAVLVAALLPGGMLLKMAGPCGQALCYCPTEKSSPKKCHLFMDTEERSPSAPVLTLGSTVVKNAIPVVAHHLVFNGMIETPEQVMRMSEINISSDNPCADPFAIVQHIIDVRCTPPRA
jgi:hypothetical protein